MRPQKNGTIDAKPTRKNATSRTVKDVLRNSVQMRSANQTHMGTNQRIFSAAVTLFIQSLRRLLANPQRLLQGLTRFIPNVWAQFHYRRRLRNRDEMHGNIIVAKQIELRSVAFGEFLTRFRFGLGRCDRWRLLRSSRGRLFRRS